MVAIVFVKIHGKLSLENELDSSYQKKTSILGANLWDNCIQERATFLIIIKTNKGICFYQSN